MKSFFLVSLGCLVLGTPARAEFQKGSQTLSLQAGVGGSDNDFEWSSVSSNGRDEQATDGGGSFGGQYVYYAHGSPAIGLGVDVSHNFFQDNAALNVFPNRNSNSHFRPTTLMAIAKLAYPRGRFRPYIFAGVGIHNTHMLLELQPAGGATWAGGGTDTRKIIDGYGMAAAVGWGIGGDWFPGPKESFFLGLELRANYLASADYGVTPEGRAAGFNDAHGDLTFSNLYLRTGFKFGN